MSSSERSGLRVAAQKSWLLFYCSSMYSTQPGQFVQLHKDLAILYHSAARIPSHCCIFSSAAICAFSYLIGLLFCQRSGEYWLQMFDNFSGTIPLLIIGFFELVGVSWIYGLKRQVCNQIFTLKLFYNYTKLKDHCWVQNHRTQKLRPKWLMGNMLIRCILTMLRVLQSECKNAYLASN